MTRQLAASTLARFKKRLLEEQTGLRRTIEEHRAILEEARLTQASGERSADPTSTESGSVATVMEAELSIINNTERVAQLVEDALQRIEDGTYGICEDCGKPIPIARLDALPYVTLCVECASKR